jgi:hypothetical protein
MVFLRSLWTRLLLKNLVLFFVLVSCTSSRDKQDAVSIHWTNDQATAISIPIEYVKQIQGDSIPHLLSVHLGGPLQQPAILGTYTITKEAVDFQPLIPFTRGLAYEVRVSGKKVSEITIPQAALTEAPEVLGIYPTRDTLPLNLLKIYIRFSKPMREGQSLQHVVLLKDGRDTVRGVFLDLQPELWNADRAMLTLWLDPGRIKRDLQPNKKLGSPLEKGAHYQIIVDAQWKDHKGANLAKTFTKIFTVTSRDSLSPNINQWEVVTPAAGTRDPFKIDLHESLDYALLKECLQVVDEKRNNVEGTVELLEHESVLTFIPAVSWSKSSYVLKIEARLEDLAGNNLNRLFDRDITVDKAVPIDMVYAREFAVK